MGHLIKGQWALEKKYEKEQSVALALKPEQGPRGIWWKSLKSLPQCSLQGCIGGV